MKTRLQKTATIFKLIIISFLLSPNKISAAADAPTETDPFDPGLAVGSINTTPGLDRYNTQAGGIGLMLFISTLIKLATIVAGVWVLFNFILAGYTYVTSSGDAGAHGKVQNKITLSVLGLILIVATYTIIGIIGFVFFGDAGYILNPEITGPGLL